MNPTATTLVPQPAPINGTVEDVAAFFRVSVWTVREWTTKAKGSPALAHWNEDRRVMIPESAVIAKYARGYRGAKGLKLEDNEKLALRDWRAHMELRAQFAAHNAERERIANQQSEIIFEAAAATPTCSVSRRSAVPNRRPAAASIHHHHEKEAA